MSTGVRLRPSLAFPGYVWLEDWSGGKRTNRRLFMNERCALGVAENERKKILPNPAPAQKSKPKKGEQ